MQLISFVENEFEVEIDDAEVTADHFRTVGAIESLVTQKARVG
jgi:acyl carrier protein